MKRIVLLLGLLLLSISLFGQNKGKGQGQFAKSSAKAGTSVSVSVSAVFGESDRRVIQQWVQGVQPSKLPPGLAKRGGLPPGLQKQLRRGGALPPGLEKRISTFPVDLTERLGPLPSGCDCDRIFLDGKALIVARAASAILDVISLF